MRNHQSDSSREEVDGNASWIIEELEYLAAEDDARDRAEAAEAAERDHRKSTAPAPPATGGFLDLAEALDEVRRTSPMPRAARRRRLPRRA